MKFRWKIHRLLLSFALVFVSQGWLASDSAAADMACTDCHFEQQDAKYVHSPAQEGFCEGCHEATPKHLEEGGPGGVKTDRSPSACYQCHDAKDEGKNVHPALEMDDCVQCHNPHGSDNEQLLILPKNQLCFECHDPVPAAATEGSQHSVVSDAESCMNCHDPHSSDQSALLLQERQTLCLSCHNQTLDTGAEQPVANIGEKLEMPVVHDPAAWDEGCTTCHAPHGSQYANLLTAAFPAKNYSRYEPGDGKAKNTYELCFDCHDTGLLSRDGDTGFRNDIRQDGSVVSENLHWLHVVDAAGSEDKSRGRSCAVCHDSHGAINSHLVRSSWPMRLAQMPLLFEARSEGGTCLRSCHAPKTYRRMD